MYRLDRNMMLYYLQKLQFRQHKKKKLAIQIGTTKYFEYLEQHFPLKTSTIKEKN